MCEVRVFFIFCMYTFNQVVYKDCELVELNEPYVAGYLSFREAQPLLECYSRLQSSHSQCMPQVSCFFNKIQMLYQNIYDIFFILQALLIDGNGILHARRKYLIIDYQNNFNKHVMDHVLFQNVAWHVMLESNLIFLLLGQLKTYSMWTGLRRMNSIKRKLERNYNLIEFAIRRQLQKCDMSYYTCNASLMSDVFKYS